MVARKAVAGGPELEVWGPYGARAKSKPIHKQANKRPPLALRPPAPGTPNAPMEPTLPCHMLLRSHDPPKKIYPSPRNMFPEFKREAANDNNEGSDNSDGGDDDPPNNDGQDRLPNRPQQEEEESNEDKGKDGGYPTRAKRKRRKSKAPTTNSKTKKKKDYKQIELVDFHKLIDTGDTDRLTLEQKGHYDESGCPILAADHCMQGMTMFFHLSHQ